MQCSGSAENFAVDPYCGAGLNSGGPGGQWPIPNCGGPMCHHGPGPGPPQGPGPGPGLGGMIGGGLGPGGHGMVPGGLGGVGGLGGSGVGVGVGIGSLGGGGIGLPPLVHGPSQLSLHGPMPPPGLCNPCSNTNSFNSVPLPGPSRWGPRTSCPVHSPFRIRVPNGSICSGHQVGGHFYLQYLHLSLKHIGTNGMKWALDLSTC